MANVSLPTFQEESWVTDIVRGLVWRDCLVFVRWVLICVLGLFKDSSAIIIIDLEVFQVSSLQCVTQKLIIQKTFSTEQEFIQ